MNRTRDPFGFTRVVYDDDGNVAPTVRKLLAYRPATPRHVDAEFLRGHIDGRADLSRTIFASVHETPPSPIPAQPREAVPAGALLAAMTSSIGSAIARGPCAVALSGGLDSAIVLAIARSLLPTIPAYVLAPAMAGYDESERARTTAARFGHNLVVVDVDANAFVDALPRAIAAFECPLFNAHPVQKVLLAERIARDGCACALSGDGADHVVKRDQSADYLPLANAAFGASNVALCAPFLDDAVSAILMSEPPDPEKRAIRELGATLGVDDALVAGPKRSQWAPPVELTRLIDDRDLERVASIIGRSAPHAFPSDRERMLWSTSALLLASFA